jgi:hypothetical protein
MCSDVSECHRMNASALFEGKCEVVEHL